MLFAITIVRNTGGLFKGSSRTALNSARESSCWHTKGAGEGCGGRVAGELERRTASKYTDWETLGEAALAKGRSECYRNRDGKKKPRLFVFAC